MTVPPLPPPPPLKRQALRLVETSFLASTAALVWLVSFYINPASPILRLFFPLPVALAVMRWDVGTGRLALAVSTLLLTILLGPTRSILYFMPYGCLGLLLGWLWRRQRSWYCSVGGGACLSGAGLAFQILLSSILLGENIWTYLTLQLTGFVDWLLDWVLGWFGLAATTPAWSIQMAVLALIVLNALLYAFTVHLIAALVMERLGHPIPNPPHWVQVLLA